MLHTAVLTLVASLRNMRGQEAPLLSAAHLNKAMQIWMDVQLPGCDFSPELPFTYLLPCLLPTHPHLLPLSLCFLLTPHSVTYLKHLAKCKTQPSCSIPLTGDRPFAQSDAKAGQLQ